MLLLSVANTGMQKVYLPALQLSPCKEGKSSMVRTCTSLNHVDIIVSVAIVHYLIVLYVARVLAKTFEYKVAPLSLSNNTAPPMYSTTKALNKQSKIRKLGNYCRHPCQQIKLSQSWVSYWQWFDCDRTEWQTRAYSCVWWNTFNGTSAVLSIS